LIRTLRAREGHRQDFLDPALERSTIGGPVFSEAQLPHHCL
jgi:hypothetical protein